MRRIGLFTVGTLLAAVILSPLTTEAPPAADKAPLDLTSEYLLLATTRTSTMQKELNEAALAGYRVLAGSRTSGGELALVLRNTGTLAEPYEYRLLATQLTSTMQKELREAATLGFRLLPRTVMGGETEIVLVMEKAPGPLTATEYLLLATKLTGTLQRELSQAAGQGYAVQGLVSRKEHMVILERSVSGGAEPRRTAPADYLLLATEKTSTMQKELDKAAKEGYRVLAGSPTSETEIMLLLGRETQTPGPYHYKLLAANKSSTLEKELNEAAAKGFRLRRETVAGKRGSGGGWRGVLKGVSVGGVGTFGVVGAPDEIVAVTEKAPETAGRHRYLVLGTMKTSTMQKELSQATREGFEVAAVVSCPGKEDTPQLMGVMANLLVVLEKELPGEAGLR